MYFFSVVNVPTDHLIFRTPAFAPFNMNPFVTKPSVLSMYCPNRGST